MNLLKQAEKDRISEVVVRTLIRSGGQLLLVERSVAGEYLVPEALVKNDESVTQAIERGVMEWLGQRVNEVLEYLAARDENGKRRLYFIVEIDEPRSVEATSKHPVVWLDPSDAVGYPVSDELREIIDLFSS